MSYNNFFPTNYQQYYPTYTNQMQNGIIWVQGEAAAKSYAVAPNTSVALWDSEANVVYIKSADASGMPSMKIIDYTVRDTANMSPKTSPQTDFATKDDISVIQKEIDALKSKMGFDRKERKDDK